ncbi:MAG: hypothetical protein WBA74_10280 [Cyclobacteriaceae bacterium]
MAKLELGVVHLKSKTKSKGYTLDLNINQKDLCQSIFNKCVKDHGGYIRVTFSTPMKSRTTGQNRHLNGHIQQICEDTGNSFELVKLAVKEIAIDMGYPMLLDVNGNPVIGMFGIRMAQSESDSSTLECALLIDAVHLMADELNIKLKED